MLLRQAEELAAKYPNTIPVMLDVDSQEGRLDSLVKDHDLVIRSEQWGGFWFYFTGPLADASVWQMFASYSRGKLADMWWKNLAFSCGRQILETDVSLLAYSSGRHEPQVGCSSRTLASSGRGWTVVAGSSSERRHLLQTRKEKKAGSARC